ncbi:sentrin-specific protease 1 [Bombus terrestris]|uniref:Sentrin-specific protease 1 n=1 Tax=Bombus terrestris TaxID=30195 RepID=A0A9B7CZN1_BOMTE|nr:sentrin-specific protease 1 [Bombus terrestris]XP_048269694.1 sentrin-specific protease 1 [Bombus terrestris]XP_048269695.1 sentrin-specific protease 1 [Bombus terrestris]
MIFNFLKKFFGWVDEAPRKRRVSFSSEKEFVTPKKHRCDYDIINVEEESIEIKDDSDGDIQDISKDKYSPIKSSSRLNGTCNIRDKSLTCCPSTFSSSKSHQCYDKANMGHSSNKSDRGQNVVPHQECSTLFTTHRLREKNQYEELLQNFFPRRIDVICDKREDKRSRQKPIEVIDLDKSGSSSPFPKTQPACRKHDRTLQMHWTIPIKEKKCREIIINDEIDNDEKERTIHSIHNEAQRSKKNTTVEKSTQNKYPESIATNTLRDRLAAKAVMREDFVPQVTKRYDERIKQRHKEAEELKKMTCVLSKHNRLAREAALEEHLARSIRLCEAVLEREKLEEPELPTLTEEMLQEVRNALISRPSDEVLVEGFGLGITRRDIHTLADLNWLNDEVINFYMNLLIARSTSNDKYPKVHAMNTFFYPKLISGGHSSLRRWTRKIDIFSQDIIVVPIHLGIHWCMSIIDFRDKSIRYYDSMGGNNSKCLSALRQYLEDESLDKKKQTYDTSSWKLECAKNIPQQMNGSDCGVFSCMFAEYICGNKKITFTQQDMPYFRNKMIYEILKSKLL